MACVVEGGRAGSSLALGTLGSPPLAERPLPPPNLKSHHIGVHPRTSSWGLQLLFQAWVAVAGCMWSVAVCVFFVSSCPLFVECILSLRPCPWSLCGLGCWGEGCRNRSKSAELWAVDGAYSAVAAEGCDRDEGKRDTECSWGGRRSLCRAESHGL